jgi:hypothetical protein
MCRSIPRHLLPSTPSPPLRIYLPYIYASSPYTEVLNSPSSIYLLLSSSSLSLTLSMEQGRPPRAGVEQAAGRWRGAGMPIAPRQAAAGPNRRPRRRSAMGADAAHAGWPRKRPEGWVARSGRAGGQCSGAGAMPAGDSSSSPFAHFSC